MPKMGDFMSNVIGIAWVITNLNNDRTFASVKPIIYLTQPDVHPGQNCEVNVFHNVFDAAKYIKAYVNTHYDPIKFVA